MCVAIGYLIKSDLFGYCFWDETTTCQVMKGTTSMSLNKPVAIRMKRIVKLEMERNRKLNSIALYSCSCYHGSWVRISYHMVT